MRPLHPATLLVLASVLCPLGGCAASDDSTTPDASASGAGGATNSSAGTGGSDADAGQGGSGHGGAKAGSAGHGGSPKGGGGGQGGAGQGGAGQGASGTGGAGSGGGGSGGAPAGGSGGAGGPPGDCFQTCDGCCDAAGVCQQASHDHCGHGGLACVTCPDTAMCLVGAEGYTCDCTPETCLGGCCDAAGLCQFGGDDHCGHKGQACVACGAGTTCVQGGSGFVCGVCGPETCSDGCCTADGHCLQLDIPGPMADQSCGSHGSLCVDCTAQGSTCHIAGLGAGLCEGCTPQCAGQGCGASDGCGSWCSGPCAPGEFCSAALEACTAKCDQNSCPSGCCDPTLGCVSGLTGAACGQLGAACKVCSTGVSCLPVSLGPDSVAGGQCSTCDALTCEGCCRADGQCQLVGSTTACGSQGAACVDCTTQGSVCAFGRCSGCQPQCEGKGCGEADGCGALCDGPCGAGELCMLKADPLETGHPAVPTGCHACDASVCGGCCDAAGACHPGVMPGACGESGASCQDCGAQGCASAGGQLTCVACGTSCPSSPPMPGPGTPQYCLDDGCGHPCPGSFCEQSGASCQVSFPNEQKIVLCLPPPPPCTATGCSSGCCDPGSGKCVAGNLPTECGVSAICVDCVAQGRTCDPTTLRCAGCQPDCSAPLSCGQSDGCGGVCLGSAGNCGVGQACSAEGVCSCPSGFADCDGTCLAVDSDPKNCGHCREVCPASVACVAGSCACPAGSHFCEGPSGSAGVCTNLASDPAHCGACGATCGGSCVDGDCVCPGGQTACVYSFATTCSDLASDPKNCGACGKSCGSHGCVGGVCEQTMCPAGTTSCKGLCTNPEVDPNNCGACGVVCPSGTCQGGACH